MPGINQRSADRRASSSIRVAPRLKLRIASIVVAGSFIALFAVTADAVLVNNRDDGRVDVVLNDDPSDSVVLAFAGDRCNALAVGDSCHAGVTVTNAGSRKVRYRVEVVDSSPCFHSSLDIEAALEDGDDPDRKHAPGDIHAGTLSSTLTGSEQSCQGAHNVVTLTIYAAEPPGQENSG